MKKNQPARKLLALLLCLAAVGLLLTACYVPADDKSSNTGYVQSTAQNFQTLAPSPTPTPTWAPTPTPVVITPQVPTATPGPNAGTITVPTATPSPDAFVPATTRPVITNPPDVTGVTATPYSGIGGVNTPTPTVGVLKSGTSGSEVRKLQQRLKDLGFYSGKVDGDFGAGTEQAVKAFQRASGLKADGQAGERTLAALNAPNAVRITATPRVTATPRPTNTPRTNLYLSLNTKSDHVKTLQARLIALGYLSGVTGKVFNGPTEYAVKAFQQRAGLVQDGTAGPDTLKAIYAAGAPKARQLAATTGESLYEGEKGEGVRAMQRRLKELGYLKGSVDGSYGAATANAVRSFQSANGLKADGAAGTATLNKLYASSAVSASSAAAGTAQQRETSSSSGTLEQNTSGSEVKRLQNRLKELGFYRGKVDGNYGPDTVTAVMNFQRSRNLTVDGKAGSATLAALYSDSYTVSYAMLKSGSSGNNVKTLQYTLYELGYYKGSVDGNYGSGTVAAVNAFQARNGLPATGIADSRTQEVLYSSRAKAAPSTGGGKFTTLRLGDSGEDVMEMKDVLLQLGYKPSTGNDKFDARTEQAVREFQERNGLAVDGVAGSDTLEALYSESAIGK